jgi:uncharacterized membrane protein
MHGADHFLELTPEALGKYYNFKWFLIAHITAGGGALILGIVQFWKKLRTYSSKLNRIIGLLYLLAVVVSSICAVVLAFTTSYDVNVAYAFSLQIWVSVWISATALAYFFAIKKKFILHQEWMTRSYLVTMAFVITGLIGKTFWFGWSVPLFVYEVIRSCNQTK